MDLSICGVGSFLWNGNSAAACHVNEGKHLVKWRKDVWLDRYDGRLLFDDPEEELKRNYSISSSPSAIEGEDFRKALFCERYQDVFELELRKSLLNGNNTDSNERTNIDITGDNDSNSPNRQEEAYPLEDNARALIADLPNQITPVDILFKGIENEIEENENDYNNQELAFEWLFQHEFTRNLPESHTFHEDAEDDNNNNNMTFALADEELQDDLDEDEDAKGLVFWGNLHNQKQAYFHNCYQQMVEEKQQKRLQRAKTLKGHFLLAAKDTKKCHQEVQEALASSSLSDEPLAAAVVGKKRKIFDKPDGHGEESEVDEDENDINGPTQSIEYLTWLHTDTDNSRQSKLTLALHILSHFIPQS